MRTDSSSSLNFPKRTYATFLQSYSTSLKQNFLTLSRDPPTISSRLTNIVGIGIILMLFCSPLSDLSTVGVTNRFGLIQQINSLYFSGMLNNLTTYPSNLSSFITDYKDGCHSSPLAWFLAYLTLEIPFEIIGCLIFAVFTGIVPGLPRTAEFFFSLTYVSWMIVNAGESLGIITNTLFDRTPGVAITLVSVVLSIANFMAGLMSLHMPKVLKGINYISPLKYAMIIVLNMAFAEDVRFKCANSTADDCLMNTGEEVLATYGLKVSDFKWCFGVLFAIAVAYRAVAYLVLWLKVRTIRRG
ncbi:hypothetical protein WICPIJ_008489 [Wickerhamomyces pijperi]|uniref:ABC-2 type transporter transmembrane domain-containing protein n=1 Tax=Wickerhamomyces pijperi TaxID=599730 RepID=A0A9P8PY94_WICPI|nr:hypothetical protein WICPIJ_008489 [Wickerhamomyces pijperi]